MTSITCLKRRHIIDVLLTPAGPQSHSPTHWFSFSTVLGALNAIVAQVNWRVMERSCYPEQPCLTFKALLSVSLAYDWTFFVFICAAAGERRVHLSCSRDKGCIVALFFLMKQYYLKRKPRAGTNIVPPEAVQCLIKSHTMG